MSRSFTTILTAAVVFCGLTMTAEAQSRLRRLRVSKSQSAKTTQAVQTSGSAAFKLQGRRPVVARLPDLQIARVTPDQDGRPPEKITIVNAGGLPAASYDVRMTVLNAYGKTIYQVDILKRFSLAAGAARTFRLPNTGDGASFSLRLDPKNLVREGNEKNNFWANSRER